MEENSMKCKIDCKKVVREGNLVIRPALEKDAMPYLAKFNMSSNSRKALLPGLKNQIRKKSESLIDDCYMILYNNIIIGLIDCNASDKSGCEAFVEIFIVSEEDRVHYDEAEALFIKFIKDTHLYDVFHVLPKEGLDLSKAKRIDVC